MSAVMVLFVAKAGGPALMIGALALDRAWSRLVRSWPGVES